MPKTTLAAGACAIALLVSGCASSSQGTGSAQGAAATKPTTGFPATPPEKHDNSGLTPGDLKSKVLAAVRLQPFSMKGSGITTARAKVDLDIRFGANGSNGTVEIDGVTVKLMVIGQDAYLNGSLAYWAKSLGRSARARSFIAKVADKWVKVPSEAPQFDTLLTLMRPEGFLGRVFDGATLTKVGTTTYQGKQSVAFKDIGDDSTFYVQRYGDPLLLGIVSPTGDGSGNVSITRVGEPYSVQAPPASQMVDLATLKP